MTKSKHIFPILIVCFLVGLLAGYGAFPQDVSAAERKVLTFSKMSATTSSRTGLFGGRYAAFEVSGLITNKTENPINEDIIPSINWSTDSNGKAKPDMTQEKLLPGETCNISWRKELAIEGSAIPEMTFDGPVEFTGLDDCQADLNEQLQAIASDYASQDLAKEKERKAKEKAKADEAKKKNDIKKALSKCEGKTAFEANEVAKVTEYRAVFEDAYDVDITSDIEDAAANSEMGKLIVSAVEIDEGGWFSSPTVTFTLDYTDPAEKKKRDDKVAAEKARKEADDALAGCEGKTANEALAIANKSSYSPSFEDSYGVDVTNDVKDSKKKSDAHDATVISVKISEGGWFSPSTVAFTLDYTDPDAARKREEEEKRKQEEKLRAEHQEAILDSEGKSAGKTQTLVDESGYALTIYDEYGTDITEKVRTAKKKSAIRKSKVTNISIDDRTDPPCVLLCIHYLDFSSVKSLAKKEGYPAEITFSNISVEVEDEDPASNRPTYFVTVSGTITSNDTWSVSESCLPALGTSSSSSSECAGIELDNETGELNGEETCGFTYHYRQIGRAHV